MSEPLDQFAHLSELAAAVREYRGSVQSILMGELLKAIEACYVTEIIDCQPDELVALQSTMKQCAAIRSVLSGSAESDGRI